MRTRHVVATGLVGLALGASVGIAAPASAATSTPCSGLLGCVASTVTSTTASLTSTVDKTAGTNLRGTVSTGVGGVVTTVLPGGSQSPLPQPATGQAGALTPPRSNPNASVQTKPGNSPATIALDAAVDGTAVPTTETNALDFAWSQDPLGIPTFLTNAVAAIANLFGWNLLALIPMAAIALLISRRMGVGRRTASGLL